MRATEDAVLLGCAEQIARRSTCSRLAVGAVLAREGRILSTGYNGAPVGMPHCSHENDPSAPCTQAVHAETNAVAYAARHRGGADGAVLYLTHAPCLACSGLLINAGIARVVYARAYRSVLGLERLNRSGIGITMMGEHR